jgi:lipopolysaccharide transport protein LptA
VTALTVLLVTQASAQVAGMVIEHFRSPQYDEQGKMTSQLFGDMATMEEDGTVRIDGVRVEFYQADEIFLTASSPYCFYDRETKLIESDAPVRAEMEGFLLTGKGFELAADAQTVHVKDESRVEINDVMQQTDLEPVAEGAVSTNLTVITSKELFMNYINRKAKFVDSVHVDDSKIEMDSGSLEISFSEKNEIDWIEALTEVRILSDGREAYADKAVYDIKTDEFVLEGNPRLVDGQSTLLGERIRFWRASEKMVCEQADGAVDPQADPEPKQRVKLILHPDGGMESKILEKP